jgi:hypothetical protein
MYVENADQFRLRREIRPRRETGVQIYKSSGLINDGFSVSSFLSNFSSSEQQES